MREATGQPRTPYTRRLFRHRLPLLGAAVAVLTMLGPFGTFQDLSPVQRLAYWGGLIGSGFLAFEATAQTAVRVLKERARAWRTLLAGVILVVTIVQTVSVALVEQAVRGHDFLTPLGLAELFVYVAVITLLVSAFPVWAELRDRGLLDPPRPAAEPEPVPESAAGAALPGPAPFLSRIPPRLGRDLLALEMEDHYVRVHTAEGSDLILMRLRDAIAELAGLDGLQVHRSYWVAAAAVTGVERKPDGKLTLLLRNGLRVPVSRSYAAAVRAAGWPLQQGAVKANS